MRKLYLCLLSFTIFFALLPFLSMYLRGFDLIQLGGIVSNTGVSILFAWKAWIAKD